MATISRVPPSLFRVFAFCVSVCFFPACSSEGVPETTEADRVLINGNIITVDAADSIAQALAIRGGKIVAIGTNEEIRSLAGTGTETIDLQGLTVTPGLLDAHCHFAGGGFDMLYEMDLSYPHVKSIEDVKQKVREQVAQLKPGEWVRGRGWDEGKFAELRYIYAADLDEVAPDNPVWLTHTMGHYGAANSLALKMAEIDRSSPDPAGGTIDKGKGGRPSGVLKESAQRLVTTLIPGPSPGQREDGIRRIVEEFNKEGMTALKEPGIRANVWDAYRRVQADGDLKVRVFALWRPGRTLESARELLARIGSVTKPHEGTGDDHLISGGIKLAIDGSGGARTAWLSRDWNKEFDKIDAGNKGYPVIDPEVLRQQIDLFHDAGLHVSVHSIGDRGIDWVVDSFAQSLEKKPTRGLRHGIIHANIPTDRAVDEMARLQKEFDAGYPEPSATFMWWIGDTYAGNFGSERALRLNPFKTFQGKGILWADGSDFGVTPFPARYGLWASIARETLLGVHGKNPYGQAESVGIREALRSRTIWSARQMFLEDKIGSLEVGKYADIAVWDRDIYNVPVEDVKEMKCRMTLFEGEIVYQDDDAPLRMTPDAQ